MTPWTRRAVFGLTLAAPWVARAQGFPTRPIRMVVPFPAGAGPDQVARLLAPRLSDALGQPVVVENRTGALGAIGAQEVARSAPDGHTLLMGTNTTHAANVAMIRNLSYDPAADFTAVTRVITTAMVLVVKPDYPAKTLAEFITHARGLPPGTLTIGYGSGASQMSIGQLRARGGIEATAVPYRGVPIAAGDVIAGTLQATFVDYAIGLQHIQGNTLRGLGVTAAERTEMLPGIPAMAEALPGFDVTIWYGLFAPAHTPAPVVERLDGIVTPWLADGGVREKLAGMGLSPAPLPPARFAGFVREEIARWTRQAREAGIEPQ